MFDERHDPDKELRDWFNQVLVNPVLWDLEHPDGKKHPNSSNSFRDYIIDFEELGYKVRDINHAVSNSTSILSVRRTRDYKSASISGRADYIICSLSSTLADFMFHTVCVIEIQSKPDEELCELQMTTYLFLLMNTKALQKLVGFLVYNSGQCRAYKAIRAINGNVVYEENDLFHVSHIAQIFKNIYDN